MTIEQHLLIQIYATQKVYLTRVLEMVCALQETMETKQEPTGLLFAMIDPSTKEIVDDLVKQLKESHPGNSPFIVNDVISDEILKTWLDTAVNGIMNSDDDNFNNK